jgi:DNA uptake protein ComE-like DNA-binding protein
MKPTAIFVASLVTGTLIGMSPVWVKSAETTKKPAAEAQMAPAKTGPLDINTASIDELKAIRGIGDANAKKIIDGRPYKRRNELVTKKIIPQETFDKIKTQIVAKQPSK